MRSEDQQMQTTEAVSEETPASEPYRFDDRATSTGSSQADLSPVSPEATTAEATTAEPSSAATPEPSDPEASRPEDNAAARKTMGANEPHNADQSSDAAPQAASGSAALVPTSSADPAPEAQSARAIDVDLQASPTTTLYWQDLSGAEQRTTVNSDSDVNATVALTSGDAAVAGVPVGPVAMASPGAWSDAAQSSAFADMAARINDMMAGFQAMTPAPSLGADGPGLLQGSSLFGDAREALIEGMDSLTASFDAFGPSVSDLRDTLNLSDVLDNVQGLTGTAFADGADFASPPTGGLLSSLFQADEAEGSPFAGGADLLDALDLDAFGSEPLLVHGDDSGLPGLDFTGFGGGQWDHLDDLG